MILRSSVEVSQNIPSNNNLLVKGQAYQIITAVSVLEQQTREIDAICQILVARITRVPCAKNSGIVRKALERPVINSVRLAWASLPRVTNHGKGTHHAVRRIRRGLRARCFHCSSYVDRSYTCKKTDCSKKCYQCGGEDHKAADCIGIGLCFLCPEDPGKPESRKHVARSNTCSTCMATLTQKRDKTGGDSTG